MKGRPAVCRARWAALRGANCIIEGTESAAVEAWAVVLGGARRAVLACGRPATAKQDTPEPVRFTVGFDGKPKPFGKFLPGAGADPFPR